MTFAFPHAKHLVVSTACAFTLLLTQPASAITYLTWPGSSNAANADQSNAFGSNISGLFYESGALWAVQNSPSVLYKLYWDGKNYQPNAAWPKGKTLRYVDGSGAPDAEGITKAELNSSAIYVVSERNGSGSNRFSILRYDTNTSASNINASHEWNITADLPSGTPNNKGPEAIAWVPDSYLLAKQFKDETTNLPYDPANYPGHGSGLFFVGLENNGTIYVYALNHANSTYVRIATIASGHAQVMDLSFDRDNGALWAHCDDTCSNKDHLLGVDTATGSATRGKFIVKKGYKRPSSLPNDNYEGIGIAPESECVNNQKPFVWSNDSADGGHVFWRGSINCGPLF